MKKILLGIAIAGISISTFGVAEYSLSKKHYITSAYDRSCDMTVHYIKHRDGNWMGLFTGNSSHDKAKYKGVFDTNLTPLSSWQNKEDNWVAIICKYVTPNKSRTRCIVKTPYAGATSKSQVTILCNFVVDSDLPKTPTIVHKEVEKVIDEDVDEGNIFDNSLDSWFNTQMNR